MRAFVAKRGMVQGLSIPALGKSAEDVLLRVKAFGINRPDLIQHDANYPPPPGVTDVLGLEVAGEVIEANDTSWIGKEVCALVPGGAYAEVCAARTPTCLPLPFSGPDRFIRSAALPENVFTVWKNVFQGRLVRDDVNGEVHSRYASMLFHGGSSGIGTTAIRLAKAFGVERVVVTAGSESKCKACLELGADEAVNYKAVEDWTQEVHPNVDFILDIVGGDYLAKNLKVLNAKGELVIIGFLQSPVSNKVNMTRVLLKELKISGSVLRSQPETVKAALAEELLLHVWPRIQRGDIRLPAKISHIFHGVEEVEDALETMRQSDHIGKIVVDMQSQEHPEAP